MFIKNLFYLFFVMFFALSTQAQVTIKGKILEKNGTDPIPFVNVMALPSGEGTTSNFDGEFIIKTDKKIKSLTFSFIGYETLKYKVDAKNTDDLQITMYPSDIQIDETVIVAKRIRKIPKDTPAIALFRKVVKNKEENRPKNLDSYHFKEHSKIEVSLYKFKPKLQHQFYMKPFAVAFDYVDTTASGNLILPALLQEDITEYYYNKNPLKNKKIVHATMATGLENASATLILDDYLQRIDMYDNVIEAGGKPFNSPFNPAGLLTYRYFLSDSVVNDEGVMLYRLDFSPINKHSISFNGYAWIESENYAITEMEFRIPTKANLNFINEFYVKQSFEKPDDKNWFLMEEEMHIAANILKSKKGRSILIKKRIRRNDIDLNKEYNPINFEGEALIKKDSMGTRSMDWWEKNRIAPLTEVEENIFFVVDSIKKQRIYRDLVKTIYFATTGYVRFGKKTFPIEVGQLYKFLSWNSAEGIRLKFGARTNRFLSKDFELTTSAAYGFKDKQWKAFVGLRIMLPRKNHHWHTLSFSYFNDFTFLGAENSEQKFNHDNLFLALFRRGPLEKIMRIEEYRVHYEKEWINGFTTELSGSRKTFFPIKNVFEFNRQKPNGNIKSIPQFSTTEIGLVARLEFGKNFFISDYYRTGAGSRKPELAVEYKLGIEDALGGDHTFHKFRIRLKHRWAHKLGFTKYQLRAGYLIGETPYPLLFMHQGNNNFYYSSVAYNNLGEFEYASDRFAAVWIDHHFDGKILNAIPLIKLLQLRSIVIFKILAGDIRQKNREIIAMPNSLMSTFNEKEKVYVELGFGIENILKAFRVDFVWRLTQRDKIFEGKNVQKFAVKFAFIPKF